MNQTRAVVAFAGMALALNGGVLVAPAVAQTCVPGFTQGFEMAGVAGDINASIIYDAKDGNGPRLYVGGQFSRAGGRLANGVAMWDGTKFVPLGGGVPANNLATSGSGTVRAMAVVDPDGDGPLNPELWVGGSFTRAQQPNGTRITVNGIARWNGATQQWFGLTRGPGETDVTAFLVDNHPEGTDPFGNPYPNPGVRVYVATNSAQSATAYLMAYIPSGGSFTRLDFGSTDFEPIQNVITCLAKHDGRVYFGGAFDQGVRRITEDGASHEPLPTQPLMATTNTPITLGASTVGAMVSYNGRLLIGPQNTAPAGSAINMWPPESFDGTNWQPETFGPLGSTIFSTIGTMQVIDLGTGPRLYFGGKRNFAFNTADFQIPAGLPEAFNGGAIWDGTTLSPFAGGLVARFGGTGNAVTFTQTTLRGEPVVFAGGFFEYGAQADDAYVQGRSGLFWNGTSWTPQYPYAVNSSQSGNTVVKLDGVNARIVNNGSADVPFLDTDNRDGISQFDGTSWSGSSIPSVAGTGFGLSPNYIRYDDGTGEALFAFGNTFDAPDPQFTRVAKFDDATQTWNYITDSVAFPGRSVPGIPIVALPIATVFDTDGDGPERPWLIIAGNGSQTDPGYPGGNTPNIYAYTGTQWVVLGDGLPDTGMLTTEDSRVTSLAIHDDGTGPRLYASGTFTGANGAAVARYDGSGANGTWTVIGQTTAAFAGFTKIRTLDTASGPALHAFGLFTDIYPVSPNPIATGPVARWTGTDWVGLNAGTLTRNGTGGPLTPFVADMASFDDGTGLALYATGPFGNIGGINARGLGRFDGTAWSNVGLGLNSFNDYLRMNPSSLVVFDADGDGPVAPALYISGSFDNADGTHSENFARYGVDPSCTTCPPCAADYDNNGGVDGGDLAAFFADFETGETCADVDGNGGVDGGDLGFFFAVFEAGGC